MWLGEGSRAGVGQAKWLLRPPVNVLDRNCVARVKPPGQRLCQFKLAQPSPLQAQDCEPAGHCPPLHGPHLDK